MFAFFPTHIRFGKGLVGMNLGCTNEIFFRKYIRMSSSFILGQRILRILEIATD